MNNLDAQIIDYLTHCEFQKRLNSKTLKAYKIDLRQRKQGAAHANR